MAISQSFILSSKSIDRISGNFSSMKKGLFSASKSANNIKDTLKDNIKIKQKSISRSNILSIRRIENARRREVEAELEASNIGKTIQLSSGRQKMISSGGGFLERIINAIGYISAGWLINNLPTWIGMGKEFISRIESLKNISSDFIGDMFKFVFNIGDIGLAIGQNILTLNLFDSEKRVEVAFKGLTETLDGMGTDLNNAFKYLTTPLTEGMDGREDSPPLNQKPSEPSGLYPETPATPAPTISSTNQNKASYGTPEQRALLDAIAYAEGTDKPNSYRIMFGGKPFDISKGWRHPDTVVHGGKYSSAAAGRYQFMPGTWNRAAAALGLKDFSPENQDKAALWLAKKRGITEDMLRNEGLSARVANLLAPEWASFPTYSGRSYYGQPVKKLSDIQKSYRQSIGNQQQTQQQTQPQSQPQTQTQPPKTQENTLSQTEGNIVTVGKGILNQKFTVGSNKYFTKHKGFNPRGDSPFDSRNHASRDHGTNAIDVTDWRGSEASGIPRLKSLFLSLYANRQRYGIKALIYDHIGSWFSGQSNYTKGRYDGNHWDHLHVGFIKSVGSVLKDNKTLGTTNISTPQISPSTQNRSLVSSTITPSRTPQQIIAIDTRQPPNIPSSPPITVPFSPPIAEVDDGTVLNRFIKQKLLLDLTYL